MLSNNSTVALLCPTCGAALETQDDQLRCATCGAAYPVVDGIPRLLVQEFYWGEIGRSDAQRLVDDAKARGWKEAVANRFSETDDAWVSILDWQRASWIPLLALPKEAVVLDIGSGYGAITHALAAHFDEVHSIEAIPERVEFTSVRMRQEGFDNVHVVQGSALQLPYPPASFDAIIVNGVLEWIGDWDLEGSPRSAQLRFLRRLHALLKPSGRLLVGIENRIGYVSLGGVIDHSGLPFTNLLPRPLATAAIRLFANRHHRMEASSRSYRTFTYSERGYRRLFRAAQFKRTECYWVEPGYNQPYRLVPLSQGSVATSLSELQAQASVGKALSWSGRVKHMLASVGVFKRFVPEFVFIIRKDALNAHQWDFVLPPDLVEKPQFWLMTQKFGMKTTIRAYTGTQTGVILKCSTPAPGSKARIATEYAALEAIAARIAGYAEPLPFEVPVPQGSLEVGRQLITRESRAPGEQVSMHLHRRPVHEHLSFLQTQLPRMAKSAAMIGKLLELEPGRASTASWIEHAKPVVGPALAERVDALRNKYPERSGHGDFTIENVLLDEDTGRMTVIDWEFGRSGLPPLYDLFTLFLQVLIVVVPPVPIDIAFDHADLAKFHAAFFHPNAWSALFADSIVPEIHRLGLDPADTWDIFVDFMILRVGYLVERKSAYAASRTRFLSAMMDWKPHFQLAVGRSASA